MGFFDIWNIKWNIIIMLIIVQKYIYFPYIKKNSWLHVIFVNKEQSAFYFILLVS